MNNMKFSFILPAYKSEYLKEAIESILAQTYTNFELIIIDDASPFHLFEIIKDFSDQRISYYRNETNIGGKDLVAQWNHCIEYANGDYIILAADDDIYDKDYLKEIVNLIKKYPNLNIYRGRNQNIDENNNIIRQELRIPELLSFDEFFTYELQLIRCIGNITFNAKLLKEKKFPNYPLAWQTDIAVLIQLINNQIATTQKIVYSFRMSTVHISNKKNKNISLLKIQANCQYFSFLSNVFKEYENSDEFIKRNIYSIYLKDESLKIQSIKNILNKLSLFDFIYILNKIKSLITKKQKHKLILYYCFNNMKKLFIR